MVDWCGTARMAYCRHEAGKDAGGSWKHACGVESGTEPLLLRSRGVLCLPSLFAPAPAKPC